MEDTFFDEHFLSMAAEIMVYNSNYQVGVLVALEFVRNNAAVVNTRVQSYMFYQSHYNSNYHQRGSTFQIFMISLNVIFMLFLFYISWRVIKDLYQTIVSSCSQGVNMLTYSHLFSAFIIILYYVDVVLYFLTIVVDLKISTPIRTEENFQEFVDAAVFLYWVLLLF